MIKVTELKWSGTLGGLPNAIRYWILKADLGEIPDVSCTLKAKLEFEHRWAMPLSAVGLWTLKYIGDE